MIEKNQIMPLNFYKKNDFTGSQSGMRYKISLIESEGDKFFLVNVWSEPYNFEKTPEEQKTTVQILFTEEGRQQVADWLNEQYRLRKEYWNSDFMRLG